MTIRHSAVAGTFYPSSKDSLVKAIEESFLHQQGPQKMPSLEREPFNSNATPFYMVPHAGYIFSGPIAAWSYFDLSQYKTPETIIIIGPNHYGLGPDIATIDKLDEWQTPLGSIEVDVDLIEQIRDINGNLKRNDVSHKKEHSIEVQLPFLQYIFSEEFKILPITMTYQTYSDSVVLGRTIAEVVKDSNVVIIASSDLSHYEPYETAKLKDLKILDAISSLDSDLVYDTKSRYSISMCGIGPVAATIEASKITSRRKGKILKYASSGDTAGDKLRVVGYGAIRFR